MCLYVVGGGSEKTQKNGYGVQVYNMFPYKLGSVLLKGMHDGLVYYHTVGSASYPNAAEFSRVFSAKLMDKKSGEKVQKITQLED